MIIISEQSGATNITILTVALTDLAFTTFTTSLSMAQPKLLNAVGVDSPNSVVFSWYGIVNGSFATRFISSYVPEAASLSNLLSITTCNYAGFNVTEANLVVVDDPNVSSTYSKVMAMSYMVYDSDNNSWLFFTGLPISSSSYFGCDLVH